MRNAGISVCAGGIIGLGEGPKDRVGLIHQLATLPEHPESVPINALVAVAGGLRWPDLLLPGNGKACAAPAQASCHSLHGGQDTPRCPGTCGPVRCHRSFLS